MLLSQSSHRDRYHSSNDTWEVLLDLSCYERILRDMSTLFSQLTESESTSSWGSPSWETHMKLSSMTSRSWGLFLKIPFIGFTTFGYNWMTCLVRGRDSVANALVESYTCFWVAQVHAIHCRSHFENVVTRESNRLTETRHCFTGPYIPWSIWTVERMNHPCFMNFEQVLPIDSTLSSGALEHTPIQGHLLALRWMES